MERDEIITLPSGTEISVEAAQGDLARAREFFAEYYDNTGDEFGNAMVADVEHVRVLLGVLADRVPHKEKS